MKKTIQIEIEHQDHNTVVLTNAFGDTFTYNPRIWNGLENFLCGAMVIEKQKNK